MALNVGDVAPDFKLGSTTGDNQGEFQLSAHKGKNVVVLFYPLDFTPVCQSEIGAFENEIAKFSGAGAQVVAISTDTVFTHKAFQHEIGGVSYPIATDRWPYAKTAEAYGVFPPTKHSIPFVNDRAIFVVGKDGRIAWSKVYEIGTMPEPREVLDVLKKLS
ncbi:MAG: redoxin domain-containing protein [Terriglobia bacterium]